jgi:hypothetical protein
MNIAANVKLGRFKTLGGYLVRISVGAPPATLDETFVAFLSPPTNTGIVNPADHCQFLPNHQSSYHSIRFGVLAVVVMKCSG